MSVNQNDLNQTALLWFILWGSTRKDCPVICGIAAFNGFATFIVGFLIAFLK